MRQPLLILCILVLLTACTGEMFGPGLAQPDFPGKPYVFKAKRIDVVRTGPVSHRDVQESHPIPYTLMEGVELWAMQRFRTPNGTHHLVVEVKDATITEDEEIASAPWSWFGPKTYLHYRATLHVALDLYTPGRQIPVITTQMKTERRFRLRDNESDDSRKRSFNRYITSMVQEMNTTFSERIPTRFAPFLHKQK